MPLGASSLLTPVLPAFVLRLHRFQIHKGQQTALEKELRSEIKCPWGSSTDIINPFYVVLRGILSTSFGVLSNANNSYSYLM